MRRSDKPLRMGFSFLLNGWLLRASRQPLPRGGDVGSPVNHGGDEQCAARLHDAQ